MGLLGRPVARQGHRKHFPASGGTVADCHNSGRVRARANRPSLLQLRSGDAGRKSKLAPSMIS